MRVRVVDRPAAADPAPEPQETDNLPEGWRSARLLTLAELIRGVSYEKGEERREPSAEYVPLLRANNISDSLNTDDVIYVPKRRVSQEQMLVTGDVVLAMSSGSRSVVGKAARVKSSWGGTFGAFCGVLRPASVIDRTYFGLYFGTKKYRQAVSEASAGVNINNLKRQHFEDLEIPIPPLAEQRRIAEAVEGLLARVEAGRARLERVPAILKRFRQAVLAAACSGRLTEDWRESHPHSDSAEALLTAFDVERRRWWSERQSGKRVYRPPDEPEREPLDLLPDRWAYASLAALVARIADADHKMPRAVEAGIPYVSTRDFTGRSGIDFMGAKKIANADFEALTRKIKPERGDILLSRYGTVGEVRKVDVDFEFQASYSIAILKTLKDTDITSYLMLALASDILQDQMRQDVRASSQPDLGLEYIRRFTVPVPPLEEQQEIVRRVERLFALADAVEKRVAVARKQADALPQAILARAFSGKLVPTEAELARQEGRDYEPASVLLERIRQQRAAQPATKGRRRRSAT